MAFWDFLNHINFYNQDIHSSENDNDTQELLELSNLGYKDKLEETRKNKKIFSLTTEMNKNKIDEDSTLDLAMNICTLEMANLATSY